MSVTSALVVDIDDLDPDTVAKLREAINKVISEASFVADPAAVKGWTPPLAVEFDKRLRAGHRPIQADAVAASAHNGGEVSRKEVYVLGKFGEDRKLNGFTKPARGVLKAMIDEGLLPADAAMPLEPIYDPTNPSYQRAAGFRMPADVAKVFAEALPAPASS